MIKVLLADNNEAFRTKLAEYLQGKPDIQVVGNVSDGWKCLNKIRELQPDVVVMDLIMPYMDGVGVLDRLQQEQLSVKVIILTSILSEQQVQRTVRKGAMDYLVKPFHPEGIYERICDVHHNLCSTTPPRGRLCEILNVKEPEQAYQVVNAPERHTAEADLTELMQEMGFPPHVRGYYYMRDAILMTMADISLLSNVTKRLYPEIAVSYKTTASRVERAIRHAIKIAWERGNTELLEDYFSYSINQKKGKPSNTEFIAAVSNRFRVNY